MDIHVRIFRRCTRAQLLHHSMQITQINLHEIQQCTRWMYSSGTSILLVFLKKSSNSYNTIPFAGQGSISSPVKEEGHVLIP